MIANRSVQQVLRQGIAAVRKSFLDLTAHALANLPNH